MMNSYNI